MLEDQTSGVHMQNFGATCRSLKLVANFEHSALYLDILREWVSFRRVCSRLELWPVDAPALVRSVRASSPPCAWVSEESLGCDMKMLENKLVEAFASTRYC